MSTPDALSAADALGEAGDALEAIGEHVPPTEESARAEALARLESTAAWAGGLKEPAAWWAAVRADLGVAGPRRVGHLVLLPGTDTATRPATGPTSGPALDPPVRAEVIRLAADIPDDVAAAVSWAVTRADAVADSGIDLLLLSCAGDVSARVLAACLMGQDVVEALGWPHDLGVEDEAWMAMAVELRDGLRRVRGLRGRPQALLEALGSPALAAATAAVVEAAARRTPVLLDGYGALVSAVLAVRAARPVQGWLIVPLAGDDARSQSALRSLTLTPVVRGLALSADDGSGALLGLALLETACGLLAR